MRVYLSHSIRGIKGLKATKKDMEKNCRQAIRFTEELTKEFPIDFYVPGGSEVFVQRAFDKQFLSIDQILEIDCDIIDDCEVVIFYIPDGHISGGMQVEAYHAQLANKGIIIAGDFQIATKLLNAYLERKKK